MSFCIYVSTRNTKHSKKGDICGRKVRNGSSLCHLHKKNLGANTSLSSEISGKEEDTGPQLPTQIEELL